MGLERADRCHLAAGIRHRWRRDHAGNLHCRPGRQADHYCRPTGLYFQLTETPPLVLLGGLIARPCSCCPLRFFSPLPHRFQ
jgi:hypothetical protein